MMIAFQRVLRLGWEKFTRDKSSSGAALFVMVIVLLIMVTLLLLQGASSFATSTLQESVDISAYIKDTAIQEEFLQLKAELEQIPEVKRVDLVSKQEALEQFVEKHKQDELVLESLDVVGQNPLLASLNIKAFHPDEYPVIAEFLETSPLASIISSVDYHQRAPVIERLEKLTKGIQNTVFLIILFSVCVSLLVAYNTIRLTIYSSKDEIEIMRLVGASNWFIRGPFLVQGMIVGILATLISTLILFPATLFVAGKLQVFAPGFNLFAYFTQNLFWILLLQLAVGIGLGAFSSLIAMRKYLEI